MSLIDVSISQSPIEITLKPLPIIDLTIDTSPGVVVVLAGNIGPPGPRGQWVSMTQAAYNEIIPDPDILYVIIQ